MADVTGLKHRVSSTIRWMTILREGLDGNPQTLGLAAGDAFQKCLEKYGIRLLTMTKAAGEGLELRRGARPVARRYYGAPISDWADLYVYEQFRPATVTVRRSRRSVRQLSSNVPEAVAEEGRP
ncbi:MAG: hypothetical protein BroJett012_20650 [Betaproteobacteria bacterium]|nr:MAG: hypothetical protein BroJett012_20650 [Betaproteobacteria bacterium]